MRGLLRAIISAATRRTDFDQTFDTSTCRASAVAMSGTGDTVKMAWQSGLTWKRSEKKLRRSATTSSTPRFTSWYRSSEKTPPDTPGQIGKTAPSAREAQHSV